MVDIFCPGTNTPSSFQSHKNGTLRDYYMPFVITIPEAGVYTGDINFAIRESANFDLKFVTESGDKESVIFFHQAYGYNNVVHPFRMSFDKGDKLKLFVKGEVLCPFCVINFSDYKGTYNANAKRFIMDD
ncbi:hypothetical protein N9948_01025 [bacterium]|nr:hypothetical protein [bacterium]